MTPQTTPGFLKYPDTCRASFVSGDGSQQSGTSAHICFYTV